MKCFMITKFIIMKHFLFAYINNVENLPVAILFDRQCKKDQIGINLPDCQIHR